MISKRAGGIAFGVDSPRGACRNELDGDRTGLDRAFVPNHVHIASPLIDEAHPCGVDVRRARRIMSVIGRHRPGGDDDQAVTRVSVPAGGSPRRPDVALDIEV